jgi:hypothetical protein
MSSVEWFPVSYQKGAAIMLLSIYKRRFAKTIILLSCGLHSSGMLCSVGF